MKVKLNSGCTPPYSLLCTGGRKVKLYSMVIDVLIFKRETLTTTTNLVLVFWKAINEPAS